MPTTLLTSVGLGIWLMFTPWVFGVAGGAANLFHVGGALVVVVAVIAMAEPLRAGRFLNGLLGGAIIAAPWLVAGMPAAARWNAVLVGLLIAAFCLPRGPVRESYGAWNRRIF